MAKKTTNRDIDNVIIILASAQMMINIIEDELKDLKWVKHKYKSALKMVINESILFINNFFGSLTDNDRKSILRSSENATMFAEQSFRTFCDVSRFEESKKWQFQKQYDELCFRFGLPYSKDANEMIQDKLILHMNETITNIPYRERSDEETTRLIAAFTNFVKLNIR